MSTAGQAAPKLQVHYLQTAAPGLTPAWIERLTNYIQEWKPPETDHWFFGRDVPNRQTGNQTSFVWHAHLLPNDAEEAQVWLAHAENEHSRSYDRTSNHLMYYSMDVKDPYKHGLLVIRIQAEPNGHRPLRSAQLLSTWEEIAFNHQVHGIF